ncbi:MAG: hypothetical protein GQE15_13345 [Archangiaceae bacterium]|nr:hypothetical protein [Archangiaceae bacterium]
MPFLLLLALAATPELQLEPAGPVTLALGQTFRARAAAGPATTLVVWESGGRLGIRAGSVHAARFDPAANTLLDPEGLLVSAPLGSNPAVAWQNDLGVWLVVYEFDTDVWLRLVRPDGTFHPATSTPLRVGPGRAPRVASVSMGYVVTAEAVQPVVWRFALATTRLDASAVRLSQSALPWESTVAVSGFQTDVSSAFWVTQQTLFRATVPLLGAPSVPAGVLNGARTLDGVVAVTPGFVVATRLATDAGLLVPQLVVVSDGASPQLVTLPIAESSVETSVTQGVAGEAYAVSVQEGAGARFWKYVDGGAFELSPSIVFSANAAAVAFHPAMGSMSAWSTFNDGVFARKGPLEAGPAASSRQLGFARGGHANASVASWAGGDVAVWQVVGGSPPSVNATNVARHILGDGGVEPMRAVAHAVTRFDDVSVAAAGREYGVLSGTRLYVNTVGTSTFLPLAPGLLYPRVTTDRSGRLLVTGMLQVGVEEEAWVFRRDAGATAFSQQQLFPAASPQPLRPRLALDRAGTSGLAIINPAEELWGTRLTADLVARDDGGFLITNATSAYPELVADEAGGFLVLSTDYDNVWVRRVVDGGLADERMILTGFWDLGSVIEVPGGALAMATSRTTGDAVAVTLSLDGGVVVARQQTVAAGLPHTNHAAAAVADDHVTFVFGRYDVDAGAPTTRFIQWPRGGPGATCRESWECRLMATCTFGICVVPLSDAGVEVDPDGGTDAGVDAGAMEDAGAVGDAGVDAGLTVVDAGTGDAGAPDSGVEDAGTIDAGVMLEDAGVIDGGSPGDGVPTEHQYRAGCDCQQTGGAPVVLLGVLLLWWRRRSGRGG